MPVDIDPRIRGLVEQILARGGKNRVRAALEYMLENGSVTTDDLQALGYNHPPRAIGDIRDSGVPINTGQTRSQKSGRRMAVYTFGDPEDIREGRIGGRSAFPKKFKEALIERYGSVDCITGAKLDSRVLQIDHRVPYRIAGDEKLDDLDAEAFMLLDGSSQRAKSWSCEHCPNMADRIFAVCQTCFWAFPEHYEHIATEQQRRVDIVWQGDEVAIHDQLKDEADRRAMTVSDILKMMAAQRARES